MLELAEKAPTNVQHHTKLTLQITTEVGIRLIKYFALTPEHPQEMLYELLAQWRTLRFELGVASSIPATELLKNFIKSKLARVWG